jgi:hypothetical protein
MAHQERNKESERGTRGGEDPERERERVKEREDPGRDGAPREK